MSYKFKSKANFSAVILANGEINNLSPEVFYLVD
jgi:hypothetical protein